jgi:hypothetical protein
VIEKPAPPRVTVAMAAATIADDCGPGAPHAPPSALPDSVEPKSVEPTWSKGDRAMDDVKAAKAKRRCEQTSMQLSITTTSGAPVSVKVKRVELYDEAGRLVELLAARDPSIWSDQGSYVTWDERISRGGTWSVSYALSRPSLEEDDRRDKAYVVRAHVTVDGEDQTVDREVVVQREVVVEAPTSFPAMVKT